MIMPNGSPVNEWQFEATAIDEEPVDFESLFNMPAEKSGGDYSQNGLADPSSSIAPCSESASHVGVNEHPQTQNGSLVFPHPRHTETSASRTFCTSDSYDLGSQALNSGFLKVESHPDVFPMHSAGSVGDWVMPIPEHVPPWLTNPGVTQDFLPFNQHCTRETSSDRANSNETFWFTSGNGNGNHPLVDEYGKTDGTFYDSVTNIYNPLVAPDNVQAPFVDPNRYSNFLNDPNQFSMSYLTSINEPSYFAPSRWNQSSGQNDQMLFNLETESEEIIMQNALRNSAINYQNLTERAHGVALVDWNCDIGPYVSVNGSNTCYRITESSLARPDKESTSGNHWLHTCNMPNKKVGCVKDEKRDAPVATPGTACKKQSPADRKSLVIGQRSTLGAPPTCMGFNNARLKTKDERSVHHAPSQDFSRRKSDISLDDALAVPLLRHQRIALSWMVKKETKSMRCSGGILADDQGLGKTISTISLILKERAPPPSSVHAIETKQNKIETLNLDDDNDVESSVMANGSSKSCLAAGTLVVCPTSVLRQWNEELHNKVRNEANLSVLVYHGGNRTKDPFELTKYDVVLTTYAIVTMEVPKQSLDEDDTETKIINDLLPIKISPSKKRKYPPSFDENSKKDNEPSEPIDRPLAKLRWFRVILDEAQCIKNYRTQVARACWGLRAKRRWCLSGTPIQNSVDDLYSYFRFLKYNPYAVFSSFCSIIKAPIQRNPVTGYKKLQVILKTIMLRRTKGSLLNGEPIILLPPKTITLKKVEFTAEERGFYRRLEADSRAQFAEYAAAGTVKQNYINILLLLLRLRQACDHPLLVRECSSNSEWRLSVEKAKKLPHEKLIRLLNCLEASLAICGICNDPPEDAVVTTCEHVFCNQCILDHLSSDASQCPSSECKDLLSRSSVFSKSALGASTGDNTVECSGSVKYEALEPSSSNGLVGSLQIEAANALNSSKIKAALEFLLSVSKPRDTNNNPNEKSVVREKSIVFSQWTGMLDLLETCLKDSSIGYRRLDGTMSVIARDKAVKDFNALPEVTVMIMSLKAASLGLNMVAACHVILLDLWWNPTTEDQAIDRVHRIGQTRPVTVVRLTVKDTVEDRILALQQKKREMVASAFGEDETGGSQTRLTVDDMKYLFQA